ncbi:MAG: type II secretion system protein [Planctomycetota bacterium]
MSREPRQTTRGRRGYTLIELIIVIALLGLASSILIPYLNDRGNLHLQAAVRQVVSDLSYAQSDALANQEFRRVHFYADGSGYCIIRVTAATFSDPFDAATADFVIDPINNGEYVRDFATDNRWKEVSVKSSSFDSAKPHVTYDSLGGTVATATTPGTGGTVVLTADGQDFEISVAPFTGKITVAKVP